MRIRRWFCVVRLRLRSLLRRAHVEHELDEEIRNHIDRQIEENLTAGMHPEEARLRAMRAFGGVEQIKERSRDMRRVRFLEDLIRDTRYTFRNLRQSPGFTLITASTLALGIGVNTMIFSLFWPLLYPTFSYPEPERLARVYRTSPYSDSWSLSVAAFLHYRQHNTVFERLAAFNWTSFSLAETGQTAERKTGMLVTADFFPILGLQPQLGRVFTDEDERPSALPAVVLSHGFWMQRFGGDPNVIGRTIRVEGSAASVIGVMPAAFDHLLLWGPVDMWRPFMFSDEQRRDALNNYLNVIGRIKRGIAGNRAEGDMKSLASRLLASWPDKDVRESLRLSSLSLAMNNQLLRRMEWLAFGVTGLVLLIACINLANLQLARTTTRAREFALRAALGGAKSRLLRQSITESTLLSLLGGALAVPAALWSIEVFTRRWLVDLNSVILVFNFRLFLFTFLCSAATGLVFGAGPAWLIARIDANELLKEGARSATSGIRQGRMLHRLI